MRTVIPFIIICAFLLAACAEPAPDIPLGCTKDARLCPGGTSVGRDPANNCEFPECPPFTVAHPDYCKDDIIEVYDCGDYVKTVHGLLGGGVTWEDLRTDESLRCPVVGPDSMSPECKRIFENPPECTLAFTCIEALEPIGSPKLTLCTDPRPEYCTMEYAPVCGERKDGSEMTYGNACGACGDPFVVSYSEGECERMAGCPEGKDAYASQIGTACVTHYGRADIGLWYPCKKAGDCAKEESCSYALFTTTGQEIDWTGSVTDENGEPTSALRCIPQDYALFLLHTSGVASVDDDGEIHMAIA